MPFILINKSSTELPLFLKIDYEKAGGGGLNPAGSVPTVPNPARLSITLPR